MIFKSFLTLFPVALSPLEDGGATDAQLAGYKFLRKPFFEVEFDRTQTFFKSEGHTFSRRRSPPRGGGGVSLVIDLLYWFILVHLTLLFH